MKTLCRDLNSLPDDEPYEAENNDGGERQRLGAPVTPSDRVNQRPGDEKWQCIQTSGQIYIPDPFFPVHLAIHFTADIASHT